MNASFIGGIIAVVVILLIIAVIKTYNHMVVLRNRVDNQGAQIEVQLKRRADLIPNLLETTKGYAHYEQETLSKITELRSRVLNASSAAESFEAGNALGREISHILAVGEQYPELKANQNFLQLQSELKETENKIVMARQFYNDTVTKYNTAIMMFPRSIFAGLFIFISGTVCRYSSNNIKRGAQCFFIGMIMTFVMPFFTSGTVMFGILHFLGVSMMLFGLGQKLFDLLPSWVGIGVCVLLFILTMNVRLTYANGMISPGYIGIPNLFAIKLPMEAYNVGVLFPLGLHNASFSSSDYFPMMPWFFLFLAGSYFGIIAKAGRLPKFCYPTHIKWLAAVGRYTIWIYVLHQPVLYGIFSLIFHR